MSSFLLPVIDNSLIVAPDRLAKDARNFHPELPWPDDLLDQIHQALRIRRPGGWGE